MSSKRDGRFWLRVWWPVGLMVALIAVSSSVTFGTDHISGPLRWLWQVVFGPVSKARWELIHFLIRKTGHFVGYGTLGLAWLRAWRMCLPRVHFLLHGVLAVLGSALIASCDEFHQSFIPNRTGSPWDVLLDCCGAAFMCLLAWGIARLLRPKRKRQLSVDEKNVAV